METWGYSRDVWNSEFFYVVVLRRNIVLEALALGPHQGYETAIATVSPAAPFVSFMVGSWS